MCYITGGRPEGATKNYIGCTNKTPPKKEKTIKIPHDLYFAKRSSIWENGGVAFIKSEKNEQFKTLGRMYLITDEQFISVVRQENARLPEDKTIDIDFEKTMADGQSMINDGWYRRIIYLGKRDEYPIFTFTGGWKDAEIELNPPGERYLKTIIKGIIEAYDLDSNYILRYLVSMMGIKGFIDTERLIKWIQYVEFSR